MASTRKRRSADPVAAARRLLGEAGLAGKRVAAGLSGGVDSVVLLSVLRGLAAEQGLRLSAIHVNHGISPHASRWERFCAALCRQWSIPLVVRRVRVAKAGEGLEAAARAKRHEAFAALKVDAIALGHHLDDQAETVLHNLLRGAGVRGASGMPAIGTLGGKRAIRPLLEVTRDDIAAYARREGLAWVEDDSNDDTALTRNYLRHQVAPLLAKRFPRWRESFARAARHFAAKDARREGLMRAWLAEQGLRAPSEARLMEMLRQLTGARPGAGVALAHDGVVLRVSGGQVLATKVREVVDFAPLPWRGESRIALPALGGVLAFTRGTGGIDPSKIPQGGLVVALRRGGERLRRDPRRPSRTLKNLFQESAVPAWERRRLPLLYCGRDLVWAPGLGVDAAYASPPGTRGWCPRWTAD